jgi:hypothetical protein
VLVHLWPLVARLRNCVPLARLLGGRLLRRSDRLELLHHQLLARPDRGVGLVGQVLVRGRGLVEVLAVRRREVGDVVAERVLDASLVGAGALGAVVRHAVVPSILVERELFGPVAHQAVLPAAEIVVHLVVSRSTPPPSLLVPRWIGS